MKNRTYIVFLFRWVAPVVVLGCAGFFVYAMGSRPKPERKKTPPQKSIPVEVVQARVHTGTLDLEVSGAKILLETSRQAQVLIQWPPVSVSD